MLLFLSQRKEGTPVGNSRLRDSTLLRGTCQHLAPSSHEGSQRVMTWPECVQLKRACTCASYVRVAVGGVER